MIKVTYGNIVMNLHAKYLSQRLFNGSFKDVG